MKKNQKGFTLAELLIVVAVIAVLVAVAIPTFTNQLEKSRQAVDLSDLRAAYAVAMLDAINNTLADDISVSIVKSDGTLNSSGLNYDSSAKISYVYYDKANGKLVKSDGSVKSESKNKGHARALSTGKIYVDTDALPKGVTYTSSSLPTTAQIIRVDFEVTSAGTPNVKSVRFTSAGDFSS